jgi:hypothetical protein
VSSAVTSASDNFTGWATFALAAVTFGLAIVATFAAVWTKRAAKATEALAKHAAEETDAAQRQAAATVKLVEASVRPWITTDPTNTLMISPYRGEGLSAPSVSLQVRNVGEGLALIVPERTYMRHYRPDEAQPEPLHPGTVAKPAISPIAELPQTDPWRGAAPVMFNLADRDLDGSILKDLLAETPPRDVRFLIDLEYTDAAGGQPTWARFHCLRPADTNSDPTVTRIDYLHDEDGLPVVPAWISTEN